MRERPRPENDPCPVQQAPHRLRTDPQGLGETTLYRVNSRFFFAQNPELAQLAIDALQAPDVLPDARAGRPRRTSPAGVQRRRQVRPVSRPAQHHAHQARFAALGVLMQSRSVVRIPLRPAVGRGAARPSHVIRAVTSYR